MHPRTRSLRILEALVFLLLGVDFLRNAGQGGAFAVVAGAAVLLRGGTATLFAIRERAQWPKALSWGAWFALLVGGLTLVLGASYILLRGTRAVVPHALLAVLGVALLAYAAWELRGLRRERADLRARA